MKWTNFKYFDNINKKKRDNYYKYRKCDKETSNYVKIWMMKLSGLQDFEKNVALADTEFCTVGMCQKIGSE
jgi:hypothetical protein